jgi:adenine-specific DNA-methyltransferase
LQPGIKKEMKKSEPIQLTYPGKKSVEEILASVKAAALQRQPGEGENVLVEGDNLAVMQALRAGIWQGKVDLVYIDPPFATNSVFRYGSQRTATISSRRKDEIAYTDQLTGSAFLEFMRERLVFLRELMSERASLYVHIDAKAGHYLKVILDEIFGVENFRGDIARVKCNPKNFRRRGYGNIKDILLFYSKSSRYTWNEPRVEKMPGVNDRLFHRVDAEGRRYTTNPLHAPGETLNGATGQAWRGILPPPGRHWRYDPAVLEQLDQQGRIEWSENGVPRKIIYASEYAKSRLQDIWEFKDPQNPVYPTEKNLELLKTIVSTSSTPGDLVLDCFCGSGVALAAADLLGRRWIGIDRSPVAIQASRQRLDSIKSHYLLVKDELSILQG